MNFQDLNGGAKKNEKVEYMKLENGTNEFRIVGAIQPCYVYWVRGANGKNYPFECLQFDRKNEKFNPSVPDPVKELNLTNEKGEPLRCQWAYRCQVINKKTGNVEVLGLKKGMLEEIIALARSADATVNDPTDYDNGCWVKVTRTKTGPNAFNVSYRVDPLTFMKPTPLTDSERALIEGLKSIDEVFPLESPEDQRERLDKHLNGSDEEGTENDDAANEAVSELD